MEHIDDVTFDTDGTPLELLQTKHHIGRAGNLTDRSRDLWRTLGSWSDAVATAAIDPAHTAFTLISTASAPTTSAASLLRAGAGRNSKDAQRKLDVVSSNPAATSNLIDYQRYRALRPAQRSALIAGMTVADSSQSLLDTPALIERELRRAAVPDNVGPLADRLRGWWYRRVVRQIQSPLAGTISAHELEAQIDDLRDQFTSDNLPIDVDELGETSELSIDDRHFVRQLRLIAAGYRLIELAIADYKRAYAHRVRWVSDGLLHPGELRRYEARLVDEWEHHRAIMDRKYAGRTSEDDLREHGFEVYQAVHASEHWIRDRVREPFVVRGTYHTLADELKVGWHPDFVARLREVLAA
jgi:hypothetical protein